MKTLVLLLWLACLSQADIKCDLKSGTVDSAYNKVGEAALKGIKFHDDRNSGNMRLFECTCDDDDVRYLFFVYFVYLFSNFAIREFDWNLEEEEKKHNEIL